MKKFALCCLGVAAGASTAAFTQDIVLEVLGYAPDAKTIKAESADAPELPAASPQVSEVASKNENSDSGKSITEPIVSASSTAESVNSKIKSDRSEVAKTAEEPNVNADSPMTASTRSAESETSPSRDSPISHSDPGADVDATQVSKSMASATPKDNSTLNNRSIKVSSGNEKEDSQVPKRQAVVVAKPPLPNPPVPLGKAEAQPDKEMKPNSIVGKWQVVAAEHGSQKLTTDHLKDMNLEIGRDQLLIRQNGKTEKGRLVTGETTMVDNAEATQIDILSPKSESNSIKGFYFFNGESLLMVWGAPGESRPVSVNIEGDSSLRLLELKRIQ